MNRKKTKSKTGIVTFFANHMQLIGFHTFLSQKKL